MPTFTRLHRGTDAGAVAVVEYDRAGGADGADPAVRRGFGPGGAQAAAAAVLRAFVVLPLPLFGFILGKPGFGDACGAAGGGGGVISLFSGAGPAAIAEMFRTMGRSTWMTPAYALAMAIFGGFAPFIATWLIARRARLCRRPGM